ncbi:hypothetical protein [Actinocorallia libanotica]|uniref:Golgi phosphoprotein 3 GPP34 n=1 Tax=Actinocorallia libanotica TaxID=46162 RepID=A0ABN1RVH1_9ACTN
MKVDFTRTGERRYRVGVTRELAAPLVMEPAPGYHDHLPHDLVHFMVECHWGLKDGVYGQLATGGTGLFRTVEQPGKRRSLQRDRKRGARRDTHSGRDIGRSEQLAQAALIAWTTHHSKRPAPEHVLATLAAAAVTEAELAACVDELVPLADRWHSLPVGEPITLTWPWPERR